MSEQLTLMPPSSAQKEKPVLDRAEPEGVGIHGVVDEGVPDPAAAPRAAVAKQSRKGLSPVTYLFAALLVAALLWGAWVTKNILDPAVVKAPIASVRLEQIIGEYVQAQARSDTPPEVVTQQTQAFMTVLGEELKARGADGTTVMVGEAVLSQNVPDITGEIRAAIYAKVPPPAARAPAPPAAIPVPAGAPPMLPPTGQ
ncbi:MAG: TrbI F-type domain-containing protein [Erythrobacter sp.]